MKCKICNTSFFQSSWTDPPEDCDCGRDAWYLEGVDFVWWARWRAGNMLFRVADWLMWGSKR